LPGVRARWKFIAATLAKAPWIKVVPMLGSLGCPYTCSFCIDSIVPYQQLSFDVVKSDLKFLLTQYKRPRVGWHDPNFGIRFDEYMDAIEEAQALDRDSVRDQALEFDTNRIVDRVITAVDKARLGGGVEKAASV
jgi:hypothetical protein